MDVPTRKRSVNDKSLKGARYELPKSSGCHQAVCIRGPQDDIRIRILDSG